MQSQKYVSKRPVLRIFVKATEVLTPILLYKQPITFSLFIAKNNSLFIFTKYFIIP